MPVCRFHWDVLSISLSSAVFSRMAVYSYLAVFLPQGRIKEYVVGHSEYLFISQLVVLDLTFPYCSISESRHILSQSSRAIPS